MKDTCWHWGRAPINVIFYLLFRLPPTRGSCVPTVPFSGHSVPLKRFTAVYHGVCRRFCAGLKQSPTTIEIKAGDDCPISAGARATTARADDSSLTQRNTKLHPNCPALWTFGMACVARDSVLSGGDCDQGETLCFEQAVGEGGQQRLRERQREREREGERESARGKSPHKHVLDVGQGSVGTQTARPRVGSCLATNENLLPHKPSTPSAKSQLPAALRRAIESP